MSIYFLGDYIVETLHEKNRLECTIASTHLHIVFKAFCACVSDYCILQFEFFISTEWEDQVIDL